MAFFIRILRGCFLQVRHHHHFLLYVALFLVTGLAAPFKAQAQPYDLLIKGGHVIDPKNGLDGVHDIAISGGVIARVARDIPASQAGRVVDAAGSYVAPGFIDIHTHVFWGADPNGEYAGGFTGLSGIQPDGFTFRAGVTTVVDAGSAGWRNFPEFKERVIDRAQTRVLAFLNIVGHGMAGHPWEQDLSDMDPKMASLTAGRYREDVVGYKIAHYRADYSRDEWEQIDRLIEAGEATGQPVMVDFGSGDPPLSIETLVMEKFRPGDIYSHVYYGGGQSRQSILDEESRLRPGIVEAQNRGIVFDVAHGRGSFFFKTAIPAIEQGFKPNTISTDIHNVSMNGGMKDMLNVMSKLLNLGMSLQEVIEASTWNPAQVIGREELGHLSEGAVADIAVVSLREGEFGFIDANPGTKFIGSQKLETELTLFGGEVVYDLNGMAAPYWDE